MSEAAEKLQPEIGPLSHMDKGLIIHIYHHADRLYQQYTALGERLQTMKNKHPRNVTIQYRKLFPERTGNADHTSDLLAVSQLVRVFNKSHLIPSAEHLREMAWLSASDEIFTIEKDQPPKSQENSNLYSRGDLIRGSDAPKGPGLAKAVDPNSQVCEDISHWLKRAINQQDSD